MALSRYLSKLGSLLTSDGKVPAAGLASGAARANFGAGAVLQVVQASVVGSIGTSSTSYVSTGLSAAITPSSTSSKILVLVNGGGQYLGGGGFKNNQTTVFRNSTNLGGGTEASLSRLYGPNEIALPNSIALLDSPSTTSSIVYEVRFKAVNGSTVYFNVGGDSGAVAITLMEIAG